MYYIEKNGKIILYNNVKQSLLNTLQFIPEYKTANIKESSIEIENFMFIDTPEWLEWKTKFMREIRNEYLKKYIDPVISNSIRWDDMNEREKQKYIAYRQYLLDVPQTENFPKIEIKTFEDFLK